MEVGVGRLPHRVSVKIQVIFLGELQLLKSKEKHLNGLCDMIKGNESLVENFKSYFLTPLSHNFKMLHFDPNPIAIRYLVTEL